MARRCGYLVLCIMFAADASRTTFASRTIVHPHLALDNQTVDVADSVIGSTALAEVSAKEDHSHHRQSRVAGDGVARVGFAERVAHIETRVAHIEELTATTGATSHETKEELAATTRATMFETKEKLIKQLGVLAGESCPSAGQAHNMGCNIGCLCHWDQQCYQRDVFVGDGRDEELVGEHFDVGVCQQSMPFLIVICLGVFFGLLTCVVLVRVVMLGTIHAEMESQMPPMGPVPRTQQGAPGEIKIARKADGGSAPAAVTQQESYRRI